MSAPNFPVARAAIILVILLALAASLFWVVIAYEKTLASLATAIVVIELVGLIFVAPASIYLYWNNFISTYLWIMANAISCGSIGALFVILDGFSDRGDTSGNAFVDGSMIGVWNIPIFAGFGALGGLIWWAAVFKLASKKHHV